MGTKDITKEKLYDLYINKCFTQQECADYFNCGSSSVGIYLKKYDIPVRNSRSALEIEMDNDMYSILQGALLGDGCLFISKSSINADFEYTSKSYQHVYYVCEKFFPYSLSGIKHYSVYDKRTGKQYNTYKFKTLVSPTLTQEYYKWYTNKIKHIPNNLQLDPLMCKIWYIGDGSLINIEGKPTQRLHLCTNCFDKEELEDIILPQMKDFDAKLYGGSKVNNKGYMVTIYKKNNIKKFLEYIGDCPFDDYRHKWDFRDSLVPNFGQFRDKWIKLIDNGVSKEQIMEDYQCSDSTFYRILHNKHKHNGEYVIETEN